MELAKRGAFGLCVSHAEVAACGEARVRVDGMASSARRSLNDGVALQRDAARERARRGQLQLDRLVMTPTPHTEHRGTIPVPAETRSLQIADGHGTLQVLTSAPTRGQGTLRRVVLDATRLP